jgi:hypothetical protein
LNWFLRSHNAQRRTFGFISLIDFNEKQGEQIRR